MCSMTAFFKGSPGNRAGKRQETGQGVRLWLLRYFTNPTNLPQSRETYNTPHNEYTLIYYFIINIL